MSTLTQEFSACETAWNQRVKFEIDLTTSPRKSRDKKVKQVSTSGSKVHSDAPVHGLESRCIELESENEHCKKCKKDLSNF